MNIKMTKLIHESAFSDNPVTDNRYHGITSLSRMQVCQSSTLELHYKGRQLKFTLDTGVTASLITESICRFAGIPVLPATQRSYLQINGKINIYLNCEETPPLDLTVLVVPKLGCEILAGMPFIMSNQIIINTPKSVITSMINMAFTFLHLDILKVLSFVHQLTEFYFGEIPFQYQCPRILLFIMNL